jgi:predicted Rossmann fold nucleotide-binding protein DprA/Smf involved in DNA uptake
MNEYTVTMRLRGREEFLNFVDAIGPAVERLVVTVQHDDEATTPEAPRPRKGARNRVRGSKVNAVILEALSNASKTVKELKEALEAANLSPGSLSTGLAMLQRSGEVERVGEGRYGLKIAKAAE